MSYACEDCKYWERVTTLSIYGYCHESEEEKGTGLMDETDYCDKFEREDEK
jgi:hypothetical protein